MASSKRILVQCDSPITNTGFGRVSRELLSLIKTKYPDYQIDIIGVNHSVAWYSQEEFPYRIEGFLGIDGKDTFQGERRFMQLFDRYDYDFVFILNDLNVINGILKNMKIYMASERFTEKKKFKPKIVTYSPMDLDYINKNDASEFDIVDSIYLYTTHGYNVFTKYRPDLVDRVKIMNHGTNIKDFYPIKFEGGLKKTFFGEESDKFIIMNLNRNQWRKDFRSTILGYLMYKNLYPEDNSMLYLHCQTNDEGGDIFAQILYSVEYIKTKINPDFKFDAKWIRTQDDRFTTATYYPTSVLNEVYNAVDLVISTSLGEGWGLSTTEAMATKTPVIMPKHTSFLDIIGDNEERGTFFEIDDRPTYAYGWRPMVDLNKFVETLKRVIIDGEYKTCTKKAKKAYKWVTSLTWENVSKEFISEFESK